MKASKWKKVQKLNIIQYSAWKDPNSVHIHKQVKLVHFILPACALWSSN